MLFMNATAFLASFESLSRAGTFQIVGWRRVPRLEKRAFNPLPDRLPISIHSKSTGEEWLLWSPVVGERETRKRRSRLPRSVGDDVEELR